MATVSVVIISDLCRAHKMQEFSFFSPIVPSPFEEQCTFQSGHQILYQAHGVQ